MGWTSFSTTFAVENIRGKVDRKATMTHELESWGDEVVKAAMAGSTYYAVVRNKKGQAFLVVILTGVRDGDFWYKEMTDTMGPYECSCPKSVLDLADKLCPCTEEYDASGCAKAWRDKCRKALANKKKPTAYAKVKVGDWLVWHVPETSALEVAGKSIAGRNIEITKWPGKRSWITYDFGGCASRIPTKYVNPNDCTFAE